MIPRLLLALLATPMGQLGHGVGPLGISNTSYYRVVFVGDSITAGNGSVNTHPFSMQFQQTVTSRYIMPWNAGVSGNKSSDMLTRWNGGIRGSGFDAVVVLGGVNDANADVAAANRVRQPADHLRQRAHGRRLRRRDDRDAREELRRLEHVPAGDHRRDQHVDPKFTSRRIRRIPRSSISTL
jgi:hypothetical protein